MTVTRMQKDDDETNDKPQSSEKSNRVELLKTCQNLFSRTLSDEENKFWAEFLKSFSLAEVRYAFENWNRNGHWFPKPKDIGDLCQSYRLSVVNKQFPIGCHRCDWSGFYEVKWRSSVERVVAECPCRQNPALREKPPDHLGKGYGWNDMLWLYKRMQQIYATGDTPDSEALLTELDSKREDGPPEWRK